MNLHSIGSSLNFFMTTSMPISIVFIIQAILKYEILKSTMSPAKYKIPIKKEVASVQTSLGPLITFSQNYYSSI